MNRFPHPHPGLSFWLQGLRGKDSLHGHRTTSDLPATAEVAIIGAGISGAALAYFLLTSENPPKSVVLIEAREVSSGATGRNGGHTRPDPFMSYKLHKENFGKDQALKIVQNEWDTLELVSEVVQKEGIECDFWRGKSLAVFDEESAPIWRAQLDKYEEDAGDTHSEKVEWIADPDEAKKISRCKFAHAVARTSAASIWPAKLVIALLRLCIEKHGLNLQTNTIVESVVQSTTGDWSINTARGVIQAEKVVYAANAFVSTLLPDFKDKITPYRGQCSAIVPTDNFSGSGLLNNTYIFSRGKENKLDYLVQRPVDGVIVLGGGTFLGPSRGITDDSTRLPEITEHLKSAMGRYMDGWGEEREGEGLLVDWTGIMAATPDGVPYVGQLSNKPGAFITAGHDGHGMARVMTASRGLARLVMGGKWGDTGLPECFEPTAERMKTVEVKEQPEPAV